jgi:NDP-sugar pyrophosphorylase family protein
MKAIVMAGGKGTRLHPYSALFPKPLMPLGDMPIMELLLRRLKDAGVDEVILAVNHLRHLIEAFFGDGARFGVRISYNLEDQPLGTAGPVAAVLDRLGDDFILTNGDLLTTLDIADMVAAHRARSADATIGTYAREMKSEFGILDVDDGMRMVGYREKPVYNELISMGVYVLKASSVRPHMIPGRRMDMPDLMRAMVAAGQTVYCHQSECFWLDIGRPSDFALAQEMFEKDPGVFLKRKTK